MYVARTSSKRVTTACDIYCCLLPHCEACAGPSDRNKTVLRPEYEDNARCNFHKNNLRSVRLVLKRREYYWGRWVGAADQLIMEWSWHVTSIVVCCHSVKHCALAALPSDTNKTTATFIHIHFILTTEVAQWAWASVGRALPLWISKFDIFLLKYWQKRLFS